MRGIFKKSAAAAAPVLMDKATMLQWVQNGDVARLREYFDRSLQGEVVQKPGWDHLCVALKANDAAMLRLLVTWGARPDKTVFSHLSTGDIRALKIAGINPRDLPDEPRARAKPPSSPENRIPDEWKKFLKALHDNGAIEAVIAGGALRDLYHDRPIKDVDIFLAAPRFKSQEKLLRKAFNDAGIPMKSWIILHGRDGRTIRQPVRRPLSQTSRYAQQSTFGLTHAWKALGEDTEYNIVFIKGPLADRMREGAKLGGANSWPPVWQLLDRFDVGLCQIAFNGGTLITNPAYNLDSEHKTLTLLPGRDTSYDHLKRIVTKYPDFKADNAIREKIASTELLRKIAERNRFMS